jgi:hypothetical protein
VFSTIFAAMAMAWEHVDKVFIAYPTLTTFKLFSSNSEGGPVRELPDYTYMWYGAGVAVVLLVAGEYLIRRRMTY